MLTEIAWINALLGGALIGLSAVILMLFLGQIAGISGILSSVFSLKKGFKITWQLAFIVGLFLSGWVVSGFVQPIPIQIQSSPFLLFVSGLLVGFGTRMANGCTSGHGVCGLARFSERSLFAVIVFMGVGLCTLLIWRHFISGGLI